MRIFDIIPTKRTMSTQSQHHGFKFENVIRKNVFKLDNQCNDTNIHDIPFDKNTLDHNENVSIKTTGSTTICCSDILRFYDYDFTKKITIICIQYKQDKNCKIIKHIYEINYNKECHAHLFGNLPKEVIKTYVDNVKSIPTKTKGAEAKKIFSYLEEKKKIKQAYNHHIQINPKVDSSQSRVQCSITNFEKTLEKFITYKSASDAPNLIRGNIIPLSMESSKRVRHNKKTKKTI
jgi:hypothetical protein